MKKWIVLIILVAVVVTGWMLLGKRDQGEPAGFRTVELNRGDLENTVSSTGTMNPMDVVEVGTQVSGTIDQVLVDFNDTVKKGQLIAVLDKRVLEAAVDDATASLMKFRAQRDLALSELKRAERLFTDSMLSEQEYTRYRTDAETAKANVISAETALQRSRTNLNYAEIRSPIDGTVIQRNVEPGQTVAASFSTPTLFLIASDLNRMEIEALVDESDIGQIVLDQAVRFTVEAYPERIFQGIVQQIRLQPETISNVVNYTVIVEADNPDGVLLPGMTATVDFIAQRVDNALLVPNTAIRFKADDAMMTEFRNRMQTRMKERRSAEAGNATERPGNGPESGRGMRPGEAQRGENMQTVWILNENDHAIPIPFEAGATDGKFTEVKKSRHLEPGTRVILGKAKAENNDNNGFRRRRLL